jgi:hypothetical protein
MLRKVEPTAVSTSRRVKASPARARASAASALATVALRRPKSNSSQENNAPDALPHTLPPDAAARTGPDIAGITDCGSI